MPESRMGERKKIKGYAEIIYSGEKPLEFEAEDLSSNAIGVIVPMDHYAVENVRKYFQQVATIKHPRIPQTIPGVLNRIKRISDSKLKWLFSFNRKLSNIK